MVLPGLREPTDPDPEPPPPSDPGDPGGPTTPEPDAPEGPTTPAQPERGHETPSGDTPPTPAPSQPGQARAGRTRRATSAPVGWLHWWEFNRDGVIGIRHLAARRATVTGTSPVAHEPLGTHRAVVLRALRDAVATRTTPLTVRRAGMFALGRIGDPGDEGLLMRTAIAAREPEALRRSAVLALGLLSQASDDLRPALRKLTGPATPTGIGDAAYLSMGLHARANTRIAMDLMNLTLTGTRSCGSGAALGLGLGLADSPMLVPELIKGARRATLGGQPLEDIARSHVAHALARVRDPMAGEALAALLTSRTVQIQTRRAAALGLGRVLRRTDLADDTRTRVVGALRKAVQNDRDEITRGFAALALADAGAKEAVTDCVALLKRGGRAGVRPYFALALGVAAYRLQGQDIHAATLRQARDRLRATYDRARDIHLIAASSLALGLAGARDALPDLLARVRSTKQPVLIRACAANAAGLLGRGSVTAMAIVGEAMQTAPTELTGELALSLGLMGRSTLANELLSIERRAGSSYARGRIVRALGLLADEKAIEPLVKRLNNELAKPQARMDAAIALGLMGSPMKEDPVFALTRDFNFLATTHVTLEILRQS